VVGLTNPLFPPVPAIDENITTVPLFDDFYSFFEF
jgi:hypothetical protein